MKCNFCGKEKEVIVSGNDATICKDCMDHANKILELKSLRDPEEISNELKSYRPSKIKSILDEYVIDQEEAKNKIAVAIYNYKKAILAKESGLKTEIDKSNIVMVGPTGSGN